MTKPLGYQLNQSVFFLIWWFYLETGHVHRTNFQEHQDDAHQHDTIEARLRTKHNLRQSVHQHVDDDEQECK